MTRPDLVQRQKPNYTDEVEDALKATLRADQTIQRVPPGHIRYLIAVDESVAEGLAPPAIVAAILRAAADQVDHQTPKEQHE